ncbi:MAG: F0F1 ATP synthase subunit A [Bryobacteraceae bacterium]
MQEHELWVTAILNKYLAGFANSVLSLVGLHAEHPDKPWSNFLALQILVALLIVVGFALLKPRISADRPGPVQQMFEIVYNFLRAQSDDVVGHGGSKYLHFFATIFFFILFCNLIGLIPSLESPTMFTPVPLGCALLAFLYYNTMGIREQGILNYLKHFAGPMWLLAPLMIPIEIFSHLGRLLSLTARLYANMFAGEQVTLVFLALFPVAVPAVFMGLHVFVAFLQAFVFTLLTMSYVSGAVAHEH